MASDIPRYRMVVGDSGPITLDCSQWTEALGISDAGAPVETISSVGTITEELLGRTSDAANPISLVFDSIVGTASVHIKMLLSGGVRQATRRFKVPVVWSGGGTRLGYLDIECLDI